MVATVSQLINVQYPAKQNVEKVVSYLKTLTKVEDNDILYLQGDIASCRHDTDMDEVFRQESNFFYLTGVDQPGYHVIVELSSGKSILFAPKIHDDEIMWIGEQPSLTEQKEKYNVDEILYVEQLIPYIEKLNSNTIHTFDQVFKNETITQFSSKLNNEHLQTALNESRMIKSDFEISLLREANRISCEAHVKLMKEAQAGMNERELHALFAYHCHAHGSSGLGYNPIVGSGTNGAILHYHQNCANIKAEGELVLVDAGCDFRYHAADITRTFPVAGKFTEKGRAVYQLVLDMQKAVLDTIKEGVQWEDLHRLAMKVAAEGLVKLNILKGTPEEALKSGAVAIFFPHGLGHSIGLDVHDVGGYPKGVERIQEPGIRYLRMRRKLTKGMVVTVEPGIYFSSALIAAGIADPEIAKYVNIDLAQEFVKVGGVRIEDSVVVTENGHDNLTPLLKEVSEIEALFH
ncbi:hypothetical protein K502DRAFT_323862 [Neoconidiobolus thromboides FSU 785]|nr:hypothetical protein K502DRAFT_323862 [Neoconidiobolus thromboides FSU 785]